MPKNTAQRRIDSRRQNRATTISGVTLSAPAGVADHGLLLGLDDDDHTQYLLADGTRTLAGNLAVASGITIDGIDLSAHAADPAAHHNPATAGNSGISIAGQAISLASAAAGAGLAYAAGVLSVNVAGLGMSVAADAVTLSSSSNPGAAAAILASDASGYLNLVRLVLSDRLRTPTIDTASGSLTLDPAGDVVSLAASTAVQTANYASQLTGWRATYAGEGDFRYLFVDEMHAKSFIADLEQALAGGQIISKSVAMVAEAFTVPAAGAAATLRVRDLPSAANMAAFQSGDIVRLRTFSRAAGSLTIADAWGVVTSYADGTGGNEGTQTWTFTRSSAPNAGAMSAGTVIQPDSIVLDYGTSGNGYYEVNAVDGAYGQNSPYARIVSWTTHPATGQALRVQMGNLRGVYGYASTIYGIAMGDPTAANVTVEASNGVRLRQGTTDMIVLDASGNSYFAGVMTIGTGGEIRQGTGTIGSNFTGLRIWRDTNVGRIGGYASNVLQWYGDTDGLLYAGGGSVILSSSGIRILGSTYAWTTSPPATEISWARTGFSSSPLVSIGAGTLETSKEGLQVTLFNYGGTASNSLVKFKFRDSAGVFLSDVDIYRNDIYVDNNKVWHQGNDGSGSGLDADTLDTYHASDFARLTYGWILFGPNYSTFIKTGSAGLLLNNGYDIEWLGSAYGSGYGFRMYSTDPGAGGVVHWKLATRQGSASWTDFITVVSDRTARFGNTSDLYSARIQTDGNIHAQGAVTSEIYLQMKSASTPAAATGFIRMWFDGTNIKAILPGGTTKTLSWT